MSCMIAARFQGVLALSIGLGLLAAGGDDDGENPHAYESSCDAACARLHDCNSNTDMATCATSCRDDAADIGPHLSTQYLMGIDACVQQMGCVQLALNPVFQTCQREAAARVSASPAAIDLCDEVVASLQMCSGLSVGTAGCLDTVKIFANSALNSAKTCESLPCDQRVACVQDQLGIDATMMTMPTP